MNQNKSEAFNVTVGVAEESSWVRERREGGRVFDVERWLVRRMLRSLRNPPVRVELWNGETIDGTGDAAVSRMILRDRAALYRLISNPEYQFGELYSSGRLAIEGSLVAFLEAVYRSTSAGGTYRDHVADWFRGRRGPRVNTRRRARTNIHHHYDIGNDFYRLWLDEAMVYTCAYFPTPDATLEEAQEAKMEHVCRKLRLKPGECVVEAGCGWGSLALYMAKNYGAKIRAFNISHEQILFARQRAHDLGLDDRVEFVEDDYRNITGKYDAFVSVGMLEHVGPQNYRALGAVVNRCLTDTGRGLIHSIGRNRPVRMNSWIAARIFPGGYTPALSEMSEIFEPFPLSILDVENLRLHYARTLAHWLSRFERSAEQVQRMFDQRFYRMWKLYLAGSLVAFTTGWMQLFQVTFAKSLSNDVPLTRKHLYAPREQRAMESCDVLIIGGGPAGSSCARKLRAAGLDVLVLDKKNFPRDKTCAGWITPAVIEELDLDTVDYARSRVFQPITGFRTGTIGGRVVENHYDRPVSFGIRRCEFDHYLLDRCGARLRLGEKLETIDRRGPLQWAASESGWTINGAIHAPLLIGAGGHFCPVARHFGASGGGKETVVAAQEIEFELSDQQKADCRVDATAPELYFCPDLMGYAWCFRKGDFLNVGLGREDNTRLSDHVAQFCHWMKETGRIPHDSPEQFRGHAYILYGHSPRPLVGDGVVLIGDAAGLAYAQSGEGIRPAVESGLMAAETILATRGDYRRENLDPYQRQIITRFGKREASNGVSALLPETIKQTIARNLLASRWFSRHVVIDRWFLHAQQAALSSL